MKKSNFIVSCAVAGLILGAQVAKADDAKAGEAAKTEEGKNGCKGEKKADGKNSCKGEKKVEAKKADGANACSGANGCDGKTKK